MGSRRYILLGTLAGNDQIRQPVIFASTIATSLPEAHSNFRNHVYDIDLLIPENFQGEDLTLEYTRQVSKGIINVFCVDSCMLKESGNEV